MSRFIRFPSSGYLFLLSCLAFGAVRVLGQPALTDAPQVWLGIVVGVSVPGTPTPARTLSGTAGPGAYIISVSASNACGAGSVTPTQTVVIP